LNASQFGFLREGILVHFAWDKVDTKVEILAFAVLWHGKEKDILLSIVVGNLVRAYYPVFVVVVDIYFTHCCLEFSARKENGTFLSVQECSLVKGLRSDTLENIIFPES